MKGINTKDFLLPISFKESQRGKSKKNKKKQKKKNLREKSVLKKNPLNCLWSKSNSFFLLVVIYPSPLKTRLVLPNLHPFHISKTGSTQFTLPSLCCPSQRLGNEGSLNLSSLEGGSQVCTNKHYNHMIIQQWIGW